MTPNPNAQERTRDEYPSGPFTVHHRLADRCCIIDNDGEWVSLKTIVAMLNANQAEAAVTLERHDRMAAWIETNDVPEGMTSERYWKEMLSLGLSDKYALHSDWLTAAAKRYEEKTDEN